MCKRYPVVAGSFYPGRPLELRRVLKGLVEPGRGQAGVKALISPHAGYIYSGAVAGAVFSSARLPERFVLLGPSHRDIGSRFAVYPSGSWITPLGEIFVDCETADLILSESDLTVGDPGLHSREHSLEVQIPFIQYLRPEARITPILCPYFADFDQLQEIGRAIAGAVKSSEHEILIVASTDMSHYLPQATARRKDFMAIDAVLALDARKLFDVVRSEDIGMCGFQAVTATLSAAEGLGATGAELIRYQTSGDVSGDDSSVVGYAGIRIS
jgi:AmmeMemoRadiSam system protein B